MSEHSGKEELLKNLAVEAGRNGSPQYLKEMIRKLTCSEHSTSTFVVDLQGCPHPEVAKYRIEATLQEHTWPEFQKKFSFVP